MSYSNKQSSERKRVFTREEAAAVVTEVASYVGTGTDVNVELSSWWGAGQRWARNRASLTSDQREITLTIRRMLSNSVGSGILAKTNQTDTASLKGIADHINYYYEIAKDKIPPDMILSLPDGISEGTDVWSDETFNRLVTDNSSAVERLTTNSEKESFMSAGYIESAGCTSYHYLRDKHNREFHDWGRVTQAQCSVTVRHGEASGSGWAGLTSFDFNRVDIPQLANFALERCKQSLNPVRIEPGRYQVILEPQATSILTGILMDSMRRVYPEGFGQGPHFLEYDQSVNRLRAKFDLKILDHRINIVHEPSHPFYGSHVAPLRKKSTFIKNGVLVGLMDAVGNHLNESSNINFNSVTTSYQISGGDVTFDEMIESSKRTLLVSKLAQATVIDRNSLLSSGVTRDGLWLIENGKISKAVRNFKWTESPMFILNNIEQLGPAQQVFAPNPSRNPMEYEFPRALNNVVVPYIKANDFSFTSTIDAI